MVSQQKMGRKYYQVMFVPCGAENAELHHKLTRARGGVLLDIAGETYHQIYLCREHHNMAHDEGNAFARGLLIAGSVITGPDARPLYTGPDEYLLERYGRERAEA
jgi:hypothetical protein